MGLVEGAECALLVREERLESSHHAEQQALVVHHYIARDVVLECPPVPILSSAI